MRRRRSFQGLIDDEFYRAEYQVSDERALLTQPDHSGPGNPAIARISGYKQHPCRALVPPIGPQSPCLISTRTIGRRGESNLNLHTRIGLVDLTGRDARECAGLPPHPPVQVSEEGSQLRIDRHHTLQLKNHGPRGSPPL